MRPPRSKTFEQALGTTDALLVDLLSEYVAGGARYTCADRPRTYSPPVLPPPHPLYL